MNPWELVLERSMTDIRNSKPALNLKNTLYIRRGSCPSLGFISVESRLNLVYHVYYGLCRSVYTFICVSLCEPFKNWLVEGDLAQLMETARLRSHVKVYTRKDVFDVVEKNWPLFGGRYALKSLPETLGSAGNVSAAGEEQAYLFRLLEKPIWGFYFVLFGSRKLC